MEANLDKLEAKLDEIQFSVTQMLLKSYQQQFESPQCYPQENFENIWCDPPCYYPQGQFQQSIYAPPCYYPQEEFQYPFYDPQCYYTQEEFHQHANPAPPSKVSSFEELVKQFAIQNMQETRSSIQRQEVSIENLTNQLGQMATSLNTLLVARAHKLQHEVDAEIDDEVNPCVDPHLDASTDGSGNVNGFEVDVASNAGIDCSAA
ncbi:uncharacterized protein LOC130715976 [Lotus japonicus]|uniref:uncharacterized protein LOC130715976 n=1 Tax=Lotus japonicus TaxID=34305 RepID=UPI0025875435|nr:uncharacterized protein LOC130715976 [Lotus japonicus]